MVPSRWLGIDAAMDEVIDPDAVGGKGRVDSERSIAAASSTPVLDARSIQHASLVKCRWGDVGLLVGARFSLSVHRSLLLHLSARVGPLPRRNPIDTGVPNAVGQHVASDLVLPGEPDISLALHKSGSGPARVFSAWPEIDRAARHHHAPPLRAFLVKLIELVAQRLLVSSWIPATRRKETMSSFCGKGVGEVTKSRRAPGR